MGHGRGGAVAGGAVGCDGAGAGSLGECELVWRICLVVLEVKAPSVLLQGVL